MIALWASYELWLALPSYDAPSVQLNERGNHIITSAKHSHNSKLITKKSKINPANKCPKILGNTGLSGILCFGKNVSATLLQLSMEKA